MTSVINFDLLAIDFFNTYQTDHAIHVKELSILRVITQPHHVLENEFAKNFRSRKYLVKMCKISYEIFLDFLQDNNGNNSSFLLRLVNQYLNIEGVII